MTERLDLNFVWPGDDGEILALTTRIWSAPAVPRLRHPPPRLTDAVGWTPFRSLTLLRTVDPVTGSYSAVLGNPRPGAAVHFHLGSVSEQPWPETRRLVQLGHSYITLAEHEPLTPAMTSLGFLGTVPFPMLEALEVRRSPDGQNVLVVGEADPLRTVTEPIGTLGFIEPLPLYPRRAPGSMGRWLQPLLRWFDPEAQAHRYGCPALRPRGAVCLGSILTVENPLGGKERLEHERYVPLRLPIAAKSAHGTSAAVRARWTLAPMAWPGFGRRERLRATVQRARPLLRATARDRGDDEPIGYFRAGPAQHHSPLYAAVHPVTGDLFLTRSAMEAGDLGYGAIRRLGWIADQGADRTAGTERIWWASRFGRVRRYREDAERDGARDETAAVPAPAAAGGGNATALLAARSAAGLAWLGIAPGQTRAIISSGSPRALAVAVSPTQTSLLAIVADSQRRSAERSGVDYVVVSLLAEGERDARVAQVNEMYEDVCWLGPDWVLGPQAEPFVDADRDVMRANPELPFGERRRWLLDVVVNLPGEPLELSENRR